MRKSLMDCGLLTLIVALGLASAHTAHAQDQLPKLIASLESANKNTRLQAVTAIGSHGTGARSAAPALMALLDREREPQVAMQAVQALTQIGAHAQLRQLLQHQTAPVRWQAANGLGIIGPPAKKAIPDLIRLLTDGDPVLRYLAAGAIGEIGLESDADTRRVIKLMLSSDPDTRPFFLSALMNLGPNSVPALAKLLDDGEPEAVRLVSMQTLANQGGVARQTVPQLIKMLRDPSAAVRAQAAATLATMGVDAKDALPTLLENLLDKDVQVQMYSFQATITVGQADRKALLNGLKAANAKGRWNAPFVLGNGKSGKEAVPELIKDLEGNDTGKRVCAALALAQIGNDAEPAIPALKAMAKDENKQACNAAQQALAQLDQKNREAYLDKLRREQAAWLRATQADWVKLNRALVKDAFLLDGQQARLQMQQVSLATTKLSVAMKNVPQQTAIRQLVWMHFVLSTAKDRRGAKDANDANDANDDASDWVRDQISTLGVEAVPAFVDGVNLGVHYNSGFV